jgi:hypothetical protein
MEAKFSKIFALFFVRQTMAKFLPQRFPRGTRSGSTWMSWSGGRVTAGDFFDSQRVDPLIGGAIEFHECALGELRNVRVSQEHACGFHSCPGCENGVVSPAMDGI